MCFAVAMVRRQASLGLLAGAIEEAGGLTAEINAADFGDAIG